jgi:hypothetical protein
MDSTNFGAHSTENGKDCKQDSVAHHKYSEENSQNRRRNKLISWLGTGPKTFSEEEKYRDTQTERMFVSLLTRYTMKARMGRESKAPVFKSLALIGRT